MLKDEDMPLVDHMWTMGDLIYRSFDVSNAMRIGRYIDNDNMVTVVRCEWICAHLERALADPNYMRNIQPQNARDELDIRRALIVECTTRYIIGN